jgi:hypothetical protein
MAWDFANNRPSLRAERDALLAAKRPPCTWPGCGCAMPTGKDWHCPKQTAHSAEVLNSMCAGGVKAPAVIQHCQDCGYDNTTGYPRNNCPNSGGHVLLEGPRPSGVAAAPAGQPFFDPATIAKAVMTPEQEAAVRQGSCPKCARPPLSEKHRAEGLRWLQCSRCTSVYVLPDGVALPEGKSHE